MKRESKRGRRFFLVAVVFALVGMIGAVALAGDPPVPPHPLDAAHTDCLSCHGEGTNGANKVPASHRGADGAPNRTNSTCGMCHKVAK